MHYNEECDKEPACRRVEGRAGQRTTAAEEREDGRREGGRVQKLDGTEGRMGQWKWWAAQIPVCNLPVPQIFSKIFLLHFSLSPPEAQSSFSRSALVT